MWNVSDFPTGWKPTLNSVLEIGYTLVVLNCQDMKLRIVEPINYELFFECDASVNLKVVYPKTGLKKAINLCYFLELKNKLVWN